MKHRILISAILLSLLGCAGIAEMDAPVDDASSPRLSIPNPHLGPLTKASDVGTIIPQSLASDPEFVLLSFIECEDGHPVLRIDQDMASQMGIDSLTYKSFVNQLAL